MSNKEDEVETEREYRGLADWWKCAPPPTYTDCGSGEAKQAMAAALHYAPGPPPTNDTVPWWRKR
jgi:hypothetical protein